MKKNLFSHTQQLLDYKTKEEGEKYVWNVNYRWFIVIAFLLEGTHVLQSALVYSDIFVRLEELYTDVVVTKSHLLAVKHPRKQWACKEVKVELC